ncbi:MAG: adenylate/guanylate cyclase domain-containing protein, partial [Candidatus Rifleibacteriota bacterium]
NYGRTVFCVYDPETVLVAARTQAWQSRLFLGFAAFLALVLAFFSAGGFLRPLLQLNQAAGAIMKQDFSVRVPVESNNEFALLAASFNGLAEGAEQGRFLSRFVSDSVRETVQDDRREEIRRDGEALEAVILFASLGAFKKRLKSAAPEELVVDLNAFLELAAETVTASGGEIDKFIGDKVLAVFYPRKLGNTSAAVSAAIQAALAMQTSLPQAWKGTPLGIGMVTGQVLAGILGAADLRLEYTVIGDSVNFASRLCDLALRHDGGIVMDEASRTRIGDIPTPGWNFTCLGEVALKGKSERKACYHLSSIMLPEGETGNF